MSIKDLVDPKKKSKAVEQFFKSFDSTVEFLGRHGWRLTRNKVTGAWNFINPHIGPTTTKIKDAGNRGWKMIKQGSGDTWLIVQPKIVNDHTKNIANKTTVAFKLVKDKTTDTWKLVSPKVAPTGSFLKKHFIKIGNHTMRLAWNKTT